MSKPTAASDEAKLLQQALPLDENFDASYLFPDGDQEALNYLMSVRAEAKSIPHIFKSANYQSYASQTMHQVDSQGRDYLPNTSLTRLTFQSTAPTSEVPITVYQDSDIVLGTSTVSQENSTNLWKKQWVEQVQAERHRLRQLLLSTRTEVMRDAYDYYEYVMSAIALGTINEQLVSLAGEIVLQEIFGIIASELEDCWDAGNLRQEELQWIYGLLCLLEKPMLAEQAGDLNQMLNLLLKQRSIIVDPPTKASLDLTIAIITEYFGQRFK